MASGSECCCGKDRDMPSSGADAGYGPVRITSALSAADRRGDAWCRLSDNFRMRWRVGPGLYALGNPGDGSPVLVTANYRLSWNCLRRALDGRDAWLLVLDTKGINVWCAAGKGTFGTGELIARINAVNLSAVVRHRTVVLPQLGAPGVAAHEGKNATGFSVAYGPVRADDLGAYLEKGGRAAPGTRTVSFTFRERTALTPMEFFPAFRKFLWVALGCFTYMGLRPDGIHYLKALAGSGPVIAAGLLAVLAGAVVTPLLLPFLPFRSFAVKGAQAGAAMLSPLFFLRGYYFGGSIWLAAGMSLFFTAVSSYLALNFTGCTPFTNMSGVKKEMRYAVPAYIAACAVSAALLIIYKVKEWGVI